MLAELLLAAVLQLHPCDEALPVNPSFPSPAVAGFCHESADITVKVFVGSSVIWQGVPTLKSGANAEGLYYFESPTFALAKGTYTAYMQVTTVEGDAPLSEGYTFTIKNPPPGAAKKPRVKGGGD